MDLVGMLLKAMGHIVKQKLQREFYIARMWYLEIPRIHSPGEACIYRGCGQFPKVSMYSSVK